MKNILTQFRHDGKRYWVKNSEERWITLSPAAITVGIVLAKGISKKEAVSIRKGLKEASKAVDDPIWREEVDWLDFTKCRHLFLNGDVVHFCDPRSGESKKSMSIPSFNRLLKERFPSKRQTPEGYYGFGLFIV